MNRVVVEEEEGSIQNVTAEEGCVQRMEERKKKGSTRCLNYR